MHFFSEVFSLFTIGFWVGDLGTFDSLFFFVISTCFRFGVYKIVDLHTFGIVSTQSLEKKIATERIVIVTHYLLK